MIKKKIYINFLTQNIKFCHFIARTKSKKKSNKQSREREIINYDCRTYCGARRTVKRLQRYSTVVIRIGTVCLNVYSTVS